MVTYDAGLFCACEETKVVNAGLILHFSQRWMKNLLTHRKIKIQTLSGDTLRMCRFVWSFTARICDKYLNHITDINNLA